MSENVASPSSRIHNIATLASSLLIAFPLLVSSITRGILFSANPAGVDITNGLAYLTELLTFGFGALAVIIVVIIVLFVMALRSKSSLRLPLVILAVQVVAGIAILLFTGMSNTALDHAAH